MLPAHTEAFVWHPRVTGVNWHIPTCCRTAFTDSFQSPPRLDSTPPLSKILDPPLTRLITLTLTSEPETEVTIECPGHMHTAPSSRHLYTNNYAYHTIKGQNESFLYFSICSCSNIWIAITHVTRMRSTGSCACRPILYTIGLYMHAYQY